MEQALHRIGKEAQVGSAHNAGLKTKAPKSDKARKANSVKGMKADARAKAGYNFLTGAAREENRSPPHMMGQANAVVGSEFTASSPAGAVSHLTTPLPTGEFLFVVVAVSEMGQVRRGSSGVNSGDQSGREVSNLNWEYGLGQHEDQGMEEGLANCNNGLMGCLGDCSSNGDGLQVAQSDHGSLSDGSGGCVALGADQMDLEGRGDGGSSQ